MPTKKFTDLPEATTLTNDDIFAITDAPAGSAASKKITAANVRTELHKTRIYPIEFNLDEGGGTLSTGPKAEVRVMEAGNLNFWEMAGNHSTGMSINVYRSVSQPISYTGVPLLALGFSNARSALNNSLAVAVAVGDWLGFLTQKVNTVTFAAVAIRIIRT